MTLLFFFFSIFTTRQTLCYFTLDSLFISLI
jgi:hypothetical protein